LKRIKMVLALAAAMAMMLVVSVAPAMAADNNHNNDNFRLDRFNDFNDGFFFNPFFDRFDNRFFDNGFNNNGISQQNEQDVQSGDATQNITVTGGGDNSNQCVGVQGVTNTGNASNNTSVLQAGGNFDNNNDRFFDNRFERRFDDGRFFFNPFFFDNNVFDNGSDVQIDDVANFEISPSLTTTCDQQVNQAASATG
jgi:hypothetical protein